MEKSRRIGNLLSTKEISMPKVKFVQISYSQSESEMGSSSDLYAIDDKGRVWTFYTRQYDLDGKERSPASWELLCPNPDEPK